jgi:hypothetical protein
MWFNAIIAHIIPIIASAGINLSILIECSIVIRKYPNTKTEIIIISIIKFNV